jgi:hypothetical protein
MKKNVDEVLRAHHVLVSGDNSFQRRARLLQALWREDEGLPIGEQRGRPLGSRLLMPRAEERLENYLTETIRACVRKEVVGADPMLGQLYARPRIFDNLLSSQPLCFNLFGELQADLRLASAIFRRLLPARVDEVTAVRFEHSPGRGGAEFTADRSAHDVFVEYRGHAGARGFVGIEVKYHEALQDEAARLRPRYDEVADAMGIFVPDRRAALRAAPLQQVWRDHLLAGSLVLGGVYTEGSFAFLYPSRNERCAKVVDAYRTCLSDASTFLPLTLEDFVEAMRACEAGVWIERVWARYLDFSRAEAVLSRGLGSARCGAT